MVVLKKIIVYILQAKLRAGQNKIGCFLLQGTTVLSFMMHGN